MSDKSISGICKNCGHGIDSHKKSMSTGFHFGKLVCMVTNMKTLGKTLYEPKHELPWKNLTQNRRNENT